MDYIAKGAGFAEMGTGYFWKKDKLQPVTYFKTPTQLLSKKFSNDKQVFSVMRFEQKKGALKLAVCALHLESNK